MNKSDKLLDEFHLNRNTDLLFSAMMIANNLVLREVKALK